MIQSAPATTVSVRHSTQRIALWYQKRGKRGSSCTNRFLHYWSSSAFPKKKDIQKLARAPLPSVRCIGPLHVVKIGWLFGLFHKPRRATRARRCSIHCSSQWLWNIWLSSCRLCFACLAVFEKATDHAVSMQERTIEVLVDVCVWPKLNDGAW